MNLSREDQRALIDQSMQQLAGDVRFQAFMEMVMDGREAVIADLCADTTVENSLKTAAAVGELRTYQHWVDVYKEVRAKMPTGE